MRRKSADTFGRMCSLLDNYSLLSSPRSLHFCREHLLCIIETSIVNHFQSLAKSLLTSLGLHPAIAKFLLTTSLDQPNLMEAHLLRQIGKSTAHRDFAPHRNVLVFLTAYLLMQIATAALNSSSSINLCSSGVNIQFLSVPVTWVISL